MAPAAAPVPNPAPAPNPAPDPAAAPTPMVSAPISAPAPAPISAPVSTPDIAPEPQSSSPSPELEKPDKSRKRRGGPNIIRILMWVLMSVFMTIPLVLLGVYTYASFKSGAKKPKKIARPVVEVVKKTEYVIPDNINWDRPDWGKAGEWSGSGALFKNSKTPTDKLVTIKVVRPRMRFVMEGSPSRGAKKAETVNFRMINNNDSMINSLIGGFRVPGNFEYDSYEHAGRKGVPIGDYNLQVEVQGTPNWRIVAYEDLQFPDASKPPAPSTAK
jgi:hypothetical protein